MKKTLTPREMTLIQITAARTARMNSKTLLDAASLEQELYCAVLDESFRRPRKWGEPEEEWLKLSTRNLWGKWVEYREAGMHSRQAITAKRLATQIAEVMIEAFYIEHSRPIDALEAKKTIGRTINTPGSIAYQALDYFKEEDRELIVRKFSESISAPALSRETGVSLSIIEKKMVAYVKYTRWALMHNELYLQEGQLGGNDEI